MPPDEYITRILTAKFCPVCGGFSQWTPRLAEALYYEWCICLLRYLRNLLRRFSHVFRCVACQRAHVLLPPTAPSPQCPRNPLAYDAPAVVFPPGLVFILRAHGA